MSDAEYEAQRADWRSLFVYDPATGRTELIAGATLEDVGRRFLNYQRTLDDDVNADDVVALRLALNLAKTHAIKAANTMASGFADRAVTVLERILVAHGAKP